MFAQVGATYSSSSFTQTGNNPSLSTGGAINTTLLRFENPSYGLVDASLGIAKDQWTAQIFGENLADRNVSLFTSTGQFRRHPDAEPSAGARTDDRLQVLIGARSRGRVAGSAGGSTG